jgi:hypothetical protein
MYSLLALAPLAVMLFGVTFQYDWFPGWLQARFPGILWPYQWAMTSPKKSDKTTESGGSLRVRTTSDMSNESTESDLDSEPGLLTQQAEPNLMINVVTIVTSLMHNLYILSTFGLCSPYLAIIIVVCNSSLITMWKVMLGRFVTCRVVKGAEYERKQQNKRSSSISRISFQDDNIHQLMEKNMSSEDASLIAVSQQLNDAKGIFAICIWPILLCSSFFFVFVSLDIAGDQVSWTGGLWIPAILVVIPLLSMWIGMKLMMRKRASAISEVADSTSTIPRESDFNAVELNTVTNVLHNGAQQQQERFLEKE